MYALVTGASSGIGKHYAEQLAAHYHYDLFLVSNQPNELNQLSVDLQNRFAVQVKTLAINLAQLNAAEEVFAFAKTEKIEVEVLVNNAGMLIFNTLTRTEPGQMETLLQLHVVTATKLCRLFAEEMIARKKGFIINMSSMTAWTALPTIPLYNATKNYILSFSRSLWYELHPHGVHVLAVAPGSTNTGLLPFPPRYARILIRWGITMQPQTLVRRALNQLFNTSRKVYLAGAWNYISVPLLKHLPDRLIFRLLRKMGFTE